MPGMGAMGMGAMGMPGMGGMGMVSDAATGGLRRCLLASYVMLRIDPQSRFPLQ